MPYWAASKEIVRKIILIIFKKYLEVVVQSTKRATLSSRYDIREGLEGQAICCESFFIKINQDRSLGMDSNCILIGFFYVITMFTGNSKPQHNKLL